MMRLNEGKPAVTLGLGAVYHVFTVSLELKSLEVTLWDETDHETPEMWEEGEEPEPVFTCRDPLMFFDEYIFGPKYPELIDDILEVDPDHLVNDKWRGLLAQIN
ncbi:hypothetical protein [Glycomyces buryatensis]|uniref:Uncharacterized protein n=1 Tax=Glycomyces buryatensis TaxID=2570927 RepID=A0A4V4HRG8_9ACTN|nr:hypothetical protein [Glycomyces buryatensis]THV37746.1 hypothetical protein FAB82_20090 [Glycomyces buryatensis]